MVLSWNYRDPRIKRPRWVVGFAGRQRVTDLLPMKDAVNLTRYIGGRDAADRLQIVQK
jgi:hypothetical protein